MSTRLIIHQFDPEHLHVGGIDTCISDLIAYAPSEVSFAVVGATAGGRQLGKWVEIEHRGRSVLFMPVAELWQKESRRVPDSAKVAAGAVRWKRRIPKDVRLQVHRLDLAAASRAVLRSDGYIQFIHNPHGSVHGVTGVGSDSFWRFLPSVYRRLEGPILRHADHVVAFSAVEASRLQSIGAPAVPSRTWFDQAVFAPSIKQRAEHLRVACIGRLERQKDPELALRALHELRQKGTVLRATFMGSGSMRPMLERRVAELGLRDAVDFVGSGSREEVARLLGESDVLLLTSHYEGSPRVVIEALATGTPVAATDGGDPDRLVTANVGGRAETRTATDVAKAIIEAAKASPERCATAVAALRADVVVPDLIARTA